MKLFLLITILYLGSAQAALVEKYPQTELFMLSNDVVIGLPMHVYTTTFTPTTFLKTRFESLLQGSARFGVIRKSDKFEAGLELLRLKFKPLIWQEFLNTEAVFFRRNLAN